MELGGNAAAVAASVEVSPGDDGAVVFQCREGLASGEDLADAALELTCNAAAVAAVVGVTPGDDGAVVLERREGVAS